MLALIRDELHDPPVALREVHEPEQAANEALIEVHASSINRGELALLAARPDGFYPAVFGWVAGHPSFEGAPESYTVWELADRPVGGMMQMTDELFPPEVPPHWSVCFAVADCDTTIAKARELGARITMGPMDMPIGRFAGMIDPQGASFTVMQPTPSD
ncbi:MAG: hypothetical protein M3065_19005 [Actinomycetota bacterium]|nr:hypothetical protein [Actinomycetota bacterium]